MSSVTLSEKSFQRSQIPALDGIRAIAVVAVIIFHVHPSALPGGFMGVDVFFVLSGFLITSIIFHDLQTGTFSFKEFYLRRIQRLLPNAITTVAVTVLVLLVFYPIGIENQAGRHGIWTLLNLSNIFAWRFLGGYWGDSAENAPFTHFWSLGIEEQFYVLFPFLFIISFRYIRKNLRLFFGILGMLSFFFCLKNTNSDPISAFYFPHFRFWELLFGAVLALELNVFAREVVTPLPPPENCYKYLNKRGLLALFGLSLIFFSFLLPSIEIAFPGWIALFPTLGTGLLLWSVCAGTSFFSKLFETSAFTGVGKVSYSLYLWHWPSIIIGKLYADFHNWEPLSGAIVGGTVGICLGVFAYHLVECPLRKRRKGRSFRLVIIGVMFLSTFFLCFFAKNNTFSLPIRFQFDPIVTSIPLYDDFTTRSPSIIKKDENGNDFLLPGGYLYDVRFMVSKRIPTQSGIIKSYSGNLGHGVVVYGSSHALMYSKLLDDICKERRISVSFFNADALPLFPKSSLDGEGEILFKKRLTSMLGYLQQNKPEVLFLIDRWDRHEPEALAKDLETFLDNLNSLPTKVVFVTQVPKSRFGQKQNFRKAVNFLADDSGNLPVVFPVADGGRGQQIIKGIQEIASRKPQKFFVIRPDLVFYRLDGSIQYAEGKTFYYTDDDHLSDSGAEQTRSVFEKILSDLSVDQISK